MKNRSSLIAATLSLIVLTTAGLSAQIINADYQGKLFGGVGPNGDGSVFSGQGALSDPGNNFWNPVNFSGSGSETVPTFTTPTLATSAGVATGVTITLTTPFNFNQNLFGVDTKWATGFGSLLGDYVDGGGGGNFVTINNLTPGGSYNLYLYGTSSGSGGSSFTVGGNTLTTTSPNAVHSLAAGVDYVTFSNISANGSGVIQIDYVQKFAGFQLETVPEPSTAALLSIGAIAVGFMSRKRRGN